MVRKQSNKHSLIVTRSSMDPEARTLLLGEDSGKIQKSLHDIKHEHGSLWMKDPVYRLF